MTIVQDMTEEAAGGFIPPGGSGPDLAATLAALPGLLTALGTSSAGLSAWTEERRLGSGTADSVTGFSTMLRAAAGIAGEASDQFRKENEFWLGSNPAGQASPVVLALTARAENGLIPPDDDSVPAGYALADLLEELPGLFELIADKTGLLAEWMSGSSMAAMTGESCSLTAWLSDTIFILAAAAEMTSSTYQQQNAFWLAGRRLL